MSSNFYANFEINLIFNNNINNRRYLGLGGRERTAPVRPDRSAGLGAGAVRSHSCECEIPRPLKKGGGIYFRPIQQNPLSF